MYCMEFLEKNVDWLMQKLKSLSAHYVLIDMPGQVELFTHHAPTRRLVDQLKQNRQLAAVHLIDSHHCNDPSKFLSAVLLSLSAMLHLELPHVNVLSKIDMVESTGSLAFDLEFYADLRDLDALVKNMGDDKWSERHRRLGAAVAEMVQDFSMVSFSVLSVLDKQSMFDFVQLMDKTLSYFDVEKSSQQDSNTVKYAPATISDYDRLHRYQDEYMSTDPDMELNDSSPNLSASTETSARRTSSSDVSSGSAASEPSSVRPELIDVTRLN